MGEQHLNSCIVLTNECDINRVCCRDFCKATIRCDSACANSLDCMGFNTCCAGKCKDTRYICCEYDFQCHHGMQCNQLTFSCEELEREPRYFSTEMAFGGALVILGFIALRIYMACAYRSYGRQRRFASADLSQSDEGGMTRVDLPPPYTPATDRGIFRDIDSTNPNELSHNCALSINPIRGVPPPEYTPTVLPSETAPGSLSHSDIPGSTSAPGFAAPIPPPAYTTSDDDTLRMSDELSEPPPPYEVTRERSQGTGTIER